MNWLHFIGSVALWFLAFALLLAFFKGGTRRSAHDQLRDDIDQIEAVSKRGELS
jgi:hypothetical protein